MCYCRITGAVLYEIVASIFKAIDAGYILAGYPVRGENPARRFFRTHFVPSVELYISRPVLFLVSIFLPILLSRPIYSLVD